MAPVIGQQVIYIATEADTATMQGMDNCNTQEFLPATIVAVWGDNEDALVNIKVNLDGEGELWITSIHKGDTPGDWKMPPSQ